VCQCARVPRHKREAAQRSNVRIEEILDPFFGMSERRLHLAFAQAREVAPCVLFVDELDAIAFQRRKFTTNVGRPLVDQFLQEMDAIGSDNDGGLYDEVKAFLCSPEVYAWKGQIRS
jgi:SpoVK/Ycf46/Vps4 family AAA+-type ATPase